MCNSGAGTRHLLTHSFLHSFHFISCHVMSFHFISFHSINFISWSMPFHFASFHSNQAIMREKNSKKGNQNTFAETRDYLYRGSFGPNQRGSGRTFWWPSRKSSAQITKWHYSTQIPTGWWLTYPSEKYECQLGLLFQNTDQPKTTAFFCVSGV